LGLRSAIYYNITEYSGTVYQNQQDTRWSLFTVRPNIFLKSNKILANKNLEDHLSKKVQYDTMKNTEHTFSFWR